MKRKKRGRSNETESTQRQLFFIIAVVTLQSFALGKRDLVTDLPNNEISLDSYPKAAPGETKVPEWRTNGRASANGVSDN